MTWTILLLAFAGLCLGGAYSMYKQGFSKGIVALLVIFAVMSVVGYILWQK